MQIEQTRKSPVAWLMLAAVTAVAVGATAAARRREGAAKRAVEGAKDLVRKCEAAVNELERRL